MSFSFHYYLTPYFFRWEINTYIHTNYYILNECFKQANKLDFLLKFNNLTSLLKIYCIEKVYIINIHTLYYFLLDNSINSFSDIIGIFNFFA